MQCDETQRLLSELLDDVLEPSVAHAVEAHIKACSACRVEWEALQAAVAEVRGLERLAAPPGFLEDLRAELGRPRWWHKIETLLTEPLRVRLPMKLASAMAAALLVFTVISVQEGPREIVELPGGALPQVRHAAEKATRLALEAELREEPAAPRQQTPIRLRLFLRPAPAKSMPRPATVPPPAPGTRQRMALGQAVDTEHDVAAKKEAPVEGDAVGEAVSAREHIRVLLEQLGGSWRSQATPSGVVHLSIPPDQYANLTAGLQKFGQLLQPLPAPDPASMTGEISIQLQIIP